MSLPPKRPDLLAGRYRILSPLGAGGMGEVFLAEDTRLERRVAVKLLPESIESDAVARERLRREALAAAALDHPFICKVYEIGDADPSTGSGQGGRVFIVMEYVQGDTLYAASRRAPLPVRQVVEIAHELTQALDAAHRRGIVHRDLKPANVMLTPQGHVKVMDFGLAKHVVARVSPAEPDARTEAVAVQPGSAAALTDAGTRIGTPAYMSPEQVLGGSLDPRSDLFSLGVILHELATGSHPFLRDDPSETMAAILRDPPSAGSRDADEVNGFGHVIHRLLSKACAERHQTTTALLDDLEALRTNAWSTSRMVTTAPAAPAERTPFVGRDPEATELTRLLDLMLTGQGAMVLVGGEPGVGKTRLARELIATARKRGAIGLTGHCYEMEGSPPFVPFVEMTELAVGILPQALRAAMGDLAPEIAAIVPSLRRTFSDIPPLPEVPADQQRRLIFGAFLEYIRRVTQKSPLVFLLDDLHWADESTLQLLQHLAPHLATLRVLIVGTYRDVELDVTRPFAKTLESLVRQRLATRIALRRLQESSVHELLTRMSGSAPPSGLAKAVFRETEGNPFFIEEVYQHLSEEGKLFDASGAWKADLRVDTVEVPEGVRLVIGRRLDRLGAHARTVLTAAAIVGRTFPLDVVQACVDLSDDEVLDAIEEAERAQLVAVDATQRTARYGFVHELIRTTLINGLSLPRRQRLHLKIADALERLRAASLDSHASMLAHHLYQAGAVADTNRTAQSLLRAGRRALTAGAFEETLEVFDHLLSLELPESDPLFGEASEHRGEALAGLQRYDDAIAALGRAVAIYSAVKDDAGIARAARIGAFCDTWRGHMAAAFATAMRGLHALSTNAAHERALLLSSAVTGRMSPGHVDEAWLLNDEAMVIAERLADPVLLGQVLAGKCNGHRLCCEFEASEATAEEALPLLGQAALWERADVLFNLTFSLYYLGRFSAADARLPELHATAARAGHHGAQWAHGLVQNLIAFARSGDIRALIDRLKPTLADPRARFIPRCCVGLGHLYLGEVDAALEHLARAVEEQPVNEHWMQGMPEGNLFAATALAGRHESARALIPSVIRWLPVPGRRNANGAYLALDAYVSGLALIGDRDRCGALYSLTLDHIRTGQVYSAVCFGPANPQLAAALAADTAGMGDQSREHFEIALRQAHEAPIRNLQPTALHWYGRSLSTAADPADRLRGRGMVEAALTDFRSLEMVLHATLAEQFLRTEQPAR
ncbi:MAG TPA: AAA family ATPase [Vicinamibacterales bacterium]|nr:AAA family ATPase [Vicinamibacterales bacterium]